MYIILFIVTVPQSPLDGDKQHFSMATDFGQGLTIQKLIIELFVV